MSSNSKPCAAKEGSATTTPDIYRDTALRYLGYVGSLGWICRNFVPFQLAGIVSVAYVCADIFDKANASAKRGETEAKVLQAATDAFAFHLLATFAIPGIMLQGAYSLSSAMRSRRSQLRSRYFALPCMIGALTLPVISRPADNAVNKFLDAYWRKSPEKLEKKPKTCECKEVHMQTPKTDDDDDNDDDNKKDFSDLKWFFEQTSAEYTFELDRYYKKLREQQRQRGVHGNEPPITAAGRGERVGAAAAAAQPPSTTSNQLGHEAFAANLREAQLKMQDNQNPMTQNKIDIPGTSTDNKQLTPNVDVLYGPSTNQRDDKGGDKNLTQTKSDTSGPTVNQLKPEPNQILTQSKNDIIAPLTHHGENLDLTKSRNDLSEASKTGKQETEGPTHSKDGQQSKTDISSPSAKQLKTSESQNVRKPEEDQDLTKSKSGLSGSSAKQQKTGDNENLTKSKSDLKGPISDQSDSAPRHGEDQDLTKSKSGLSGSSANKPDSSRPLTADQRIDEPKPGEDQDLTKSKSGLSGSAANKPDSTRPLTADQRIDEPKPGEVQDLTKSKSGLSGSSANKPKPEENENLFKSKIDLTRSLTDQKDKEPKELGEVQDLTKSKSGLSGSSAKQPSTAESKQLTPSKIDLTVPLKPAESQNITSNKSNLSGPSDKQPKTDEIDLSRLLARSKITLTAPQLKPGGSQSVTPNKSDLSRPSVIPPRSPDDKENLIPSKNDLTEALSHRSDTEMKKPEETPRLTKSKSDLSGPSTKPKDNVPKTKESATQVGRMPQKKTEEDGPHLTDSETDDLSGLRNKAVQVDKTTKPRKPKEHTGK